MRVLFTSTPMYGHLHPLLPFARALTDAGHDIAFAAPAALAGALAGYTHFPAGDNRDVNDVYPQLRTWPGPGRVPFMFHEVFAGLWPRQMAPDLVALTAAWPPDLIVRSELEYGGCLAAEALGLPHAAVGVFAIGDFAPRAAITAPLGVLRAAHDLPLDPDLAMLHRYLTLRPFPPGFQNPALPVAPATHYVRPMHGDRSGPEELPPWVHDLPNHPVVYVGLGAVFNEPAIFRAFLAGLRDAPLTLIVTVGRDQDPATYGSQPGNVHIERYIPLSLLLEHCDLVVTNGGSGTLTAALAHGLPVVVVPVTADQPQNAARCAEIGLGRMVLPETLTPEVARKAVLAVLGDPGCRAAAERLRDEIATLPGPEHAVALLEQLARDREPLLATD